MNLRIPSVAEERYWASVDKTAMPLDEIKRRQAINAAFISAWKNQTNQQPQKTLEGEVAIQCKPERRPRPKRKTSTDTQMTVHDMNEVDRVKKSRLSMGIMNDWNTH